VKAWRLGLALAVLAAGSAGASPEVDYLLHCQGCHLPDGRGKPGAVPSLVDSVGRLAALPGGREFLVRVPGSAQSALDDADLAALLNWMVHRFGPLPPDFQPFSAAEVAGVRRPPLTDVAAARRALLERPPAPSVDLDLKPISK
jgi:mono/diheme cytochrome c family protein